MPSDLAFTEWLHVRSRRARTKPLSVNTLRGKQSCLGTLRRTGCVLLEIDSLSDRDLATFLTDRVNVEALLDLLSLRSTVGTMRNLYYALRDFEAYSKANRWVTGFAVENGDLLAKDDAHLIETFSDAEIEMLEIASRMKGFRWHLFMLTLIHTGMRVGNLLTLKYTDIVTEHEVPHFVLPITKTGKPLLVPMDTALQALYSAAHMRQLRDEPIARNRITQRDAEVYLFPWSYNNANMRFGYMLKMLEVPHRSLHKLRATLITRLILEGKPLLGIATLVGHTSIATTQKYYAAVSGLMFRDLLP